MTFYPYNNSYPREEMNTHPVEINDNLMREYNDTIFPDHKEWLDVNIIEAAMEYTIGIDRFRAMSPKEQTWQIEEWMRNEIDSSL